MRCISQRYFSAPVSNFGTVRESVGFQVDPARRASASATARPVQKRMPFVLDIDHRAVVGLEGIFGLEVDQLVGADDLEVGAERHSTLPFTMSPLTSPPTMGMMRRTP